MGPTESQFKRSQTWNTDWIILFAELKQEKHVTRVVTLWEDVLIVGGHEGAGFCFLDLGAGHMGLLN